MRNGYCPATVKTTAGPVTVARPKLRGTTAALASRPFGKTITRSNALESLVIAGFVRGVLGELARFMDDLGVVRQRPVAGLPDDGAARHHEGQVLQPGAMA
jgi:hypothetical protein